jgi:hypothetical protein
MIIARGSVGSEIDAQRMKHEDECRARYQEGPQHRQARIVFAGPRKQAFGVIDAPFV